MLTSLLNKFVAWYPIRKLVTLPVKRQLRRFEAGDDPVQTGVPSGVGSGGHSVPRYRGGVHRRDPSPRRRPVVEGMEGCGRRDR